jgi:hypothetical protein
MHDQRPDLTIDDDDANLSGNAALAAAPSGAFALAGIAVGLLVLAWMAIYVFVFLARGPVG